jgi:hypothetical protein
MDGYVLFHGKEFVGVFPNVHYAHQHALQLIAFCIRNGGGASHKHFKVIHHDMHIAKSSFSFNAKYELVDQDGAVVIQGEGRVRVLLKQIRGEAPSPTSSESASDINLFIPFSCDKHNSARPEQTPKDNLIPDMTLEEVERKVEYLSSLKEQELISLNQAKELFEKKHAEYIEEKTKLEQIKLEMKRSQEKFEELQKKFEADKRLYFIFKQEIVDGERGENDIPLLFKDTFPIFKQLEQDNKLNQEDEIKHYLEVSQCQQSKTVYMTSEFDDLFE